MFQCVNGNSLVDHKSVTELHQFKVQYMYTVKPPKRGHFGTVAFVLSSEVVLLSEVAPFFVLGMYFSYIVAR